VGPAKRRIGKGKHSFEIGQVLKYVLDMFRPQSRPARLAAVCVQGEGVPTSGSSEGDGYICYTITDETQRTGTISIAARFKILRCKAHR